MMRWSDPEDVYYFRQRDLDLYARCPPVEDPRELRRGHTVIEGRLPIDMGPMPTRQGPVVIFQREKKAPPYLSVAQAKTKDPELGEYLNAVEFRHLPLEGFSLEVEREGLQLQFLSWLWVLDRDGADQLRLSFLTSATWSPGASKTSMMSLISRVLFKHIQGIFFHEIDEMIVENGRRPFDPHSGGTSYPYQETAKSRGTPKRLDVEGLFYKELWLQSPLSFIESVRADRLWDRYEAQEMLFTIDTLTPNALGEPAIQRHKIRMPDISRIPAVDSLRRALTFIAEYIVNRSMFVDGVPYRDVEPSITQS